MLSTVDDPLDAYAYETASQQHLDPIDAMHLTPAQASASYPDSVAVFDGFNSLYAFDAQSPATARRDLLVIKRAMTDEELDEHFISSGWPVALLLSMTLPAGEAWLFTHSDTPEQAKGAPKLETDDIRHIERAAGHSAPPSGNIRCTWWIRRYDERASSKGDLAYFTALRETLRPRRSLAHALVDRLVDLLSAAKRAGGGLLIEQITIIIAKDATSPLKTLTPHLHADEYYGPRETAICSIFEAGWSRYGGTLFLPTRRMSDFAGTRTIDMQRLKSEFEDTPIVAPGSGDVLVYDGMKAPGGGTDPTRGLPHISADIPGQSARLVILMRHHPPRS